MRGRISGVIRGNFLWFEAAFFALLDFAEIEVVLEAVADGLVDDVADEEREAGDFAASGAGAGWLDWRGGAVSGAVVASFSAGPSSSSTLAMGAMMT